MVLTFILTAFSVPLYRKNNTIQGTIIAGEVVDNIAYVENCKGIYQGRMEAVINKDHI